jgi:DNA-binding transcriptional MerR regulator
MQTRDLLANVPGLKRGQVHFLIRCGLLRPKRQGSSRRARFDFSDEDLEKLRLLLEFMQQGRTAEQASRLAKGRLAAPKAAGKHGQAVRLVLVDEDQRPLKNRSYRIEALGLELQTSEDGVVESLGVPPDLLIRDPQLQEAASAFALLVEFLKTADGAYLVTTTQVDAIRRLADLYEEVIEKGTDARRQIFDTTVSLLAESVERLLAQQAGTELVPEALVQLYQELPTVCAPELEIGGQRVTPAGIPKHPEFAPLFYGGFYGTRGNHLTLGYTRLEHHRVDPLVNLTVPMGNLANLFGENFFFQLFAKQIQRQYGIDASLDLVRAPGDPPAPVGREALRLLKNAVSHLRRCADERFTQIPDSLTFYSQGLTLYTPEAWEVFIFSRSSGLVIPEEHFGDEELLKNPYRQSYFKHGLLAPDVTGLVRRYQWDEATTAQTLFRNHERHHGRGQGALYKKRCVELLTSVLMIPALELSEADFSLSPWKSFLTVVSHEGVLFSTRSKAMRDHVAHGLLLNRRAAADPRLSARLSALVGRSPTPSGRALQVIDAVGAAYRGGAKRIIKPLNKVLPDPHKTATEVVEELLVRGSKLAGQQSASA